MDHLSCYYHRLIAFGDFCRLDKQKPFQFSLQDQIKWTLSTTISMSSNACSNFFSNNSLNIIISSEFIDVITIIWIPCWGMTLNQIIPALNSCWSVFSVIWGMLIKRGGVFRWIAKPCFEIFKDIRFLRSFPMRQPYSIKIVDGNLEHSWWNTLGCSPQFISSHCDERKTIHFGLIFCARLKK